MSVARLRDAEAPVCACPAVLGSCHPARVFLGLREEEEEEGSNVQEIFLQPQFLAHPALFLHAGPALGGHQLVGGRLQRVPGAPSCSSSVGQQLPSLSVVPVSRL